MKKNIFKAVILVSLMVVLAACGGKAAPAASGTPAASGVKVDGCPGKTDKTIVDLKCRKVTVAVENVYLPFNYVLASTGKAEGWDYDAWKEICNRLNCVPVMTEAAWDGLIQGVASKQFDIGADGITITTDRAKQVDFSKGYLAIQQRLLVRKGETRFTNLESFAADPKFILGTQANTTNYETAKKSLPESRIKAFEQFPFAVQALINGDVDAVIIDQVAGMGYMGENGDKIDFLGPVISGDELGFVFTKGSDLVEPVNKAIDAMKADGSLDALNKKYFGPDFKVSSTDIKN